MGIKGLQSFVQNSCSNVCSTVNLRTLAARNKSSYPESTPTIVVDAMGCLRTWYTPNDWVHGGQWKEYLCSLQTFISAFQAAGIQLVFIFDGVVENTKRQEWVKRRLRDNKEISKIFDFIKANGQQPGRNMFFIPSGISTFTKSALRSLGQEVIISQVEGDYEVAAHGLQHQCLGILGEDSDYLIFNTVPYFSVSKLCLASLETLMYSRENLCKELRLQLSHLPLLACLLGNDVIPENTVACFQRKCMASYHSQNSDQNKRAQVICAVAAFISKLQCSQHGLRQVECMLPLWFDKTLLQKGIALYILPQQNSPWLSLELPQGNPERNIIESSVCPYKDIVKTALSQRCNGQKVGIWNILCTGESECSNTLEDEYDSEITGQALIYRPVRQHVYAILLGTGNGSPDTCPIVKEWYVYPGNQLLQPDFVQAVPLSIAVGIPSIQNLWTSNSPDIQRERLYAFLACFHIESFTDELKALEPHIAAVCCLLIYIAVQVVSLSQKDVEAFLAQVLCLPGKSAGQLKNLQLPQVESRAVHLAYLFLRGINTVLLVNSACGSPFNIMDLMPWNTFDGKLFHHKYLQCHGGSSLEEILEGSEPLILLFKKLMKIICDACAAKNRILQDTKRRLHHSFAGHQQQARFSYQNQHHRERNQRHNFPRRGNAFGGERPNTGFHTGHCTEERQERWHGAHGYDMSYPEPASRRRGQRGRGSQYLNRWPQ
ncbi:constitutive coactivator of peroxisome proliferator-activated receptor gamma isoform X2 [Xenopus laevis]|uniref:Constitutive coactivator of peroxisome proliferator-activated receptor gamma n=1 Tax=Xenopus laevis TaxID=8355 RepID=A0A8J1KPL3_XENLA|nr:constitutive coactivator of peroxisome proliferator-activated receptor gamma isoform X2 [Xenopus laevis]